MAMLRILRTHLQRMAIGEAREESNSMAIYIPKTLTRLTVYLVLSFLLSLFLFYVGVQHNPQGEFIDLDTNRLDLRYTALFMSLNMATFVAIPVALELIYLALHFLAQNFLREKTAIPASPYEPPSGWQFVGGNWKKRLLIMLGFSFVPSLLISSVALYAAYHHNPQEIYYNHETKDVDFWACAGFLSLNVAILSIGIMAIELAPLPFVFLVKRLGDRCRGGPRLP